MGNVGKDFEQQIKKSFPDYCLVQRLNDPPQSFTQRSDTRFSIKNPCDYLVFDSSKHILYCLELKTTKYKSMSFEDIHSDEGQNKLIHKHQIIGLSNFSEYDYVIAGFLFNFRDEKNNVERTYFQNIKDFNTMCSNIDKKSFNEMDIILNNAVKLNGEKKRVKYVWDIDKLFQSLGGK